MTDQGSEHPDTAWVKGFVAGREQGADEARAVARRLVDTHIFDLPIGEDVTYSRGYSAGIAAARESLRSALDGA